MNIFDWLFGKEEAPKTSEPKTSESRIPVPGERWVLTPSDKDKDDPFPSKKEEFTPVRILEVKMGWVRYYMGDLFPDNRMKITRFIDIYEPYNC